jgi:hypothetical protein
MFQFSQVRLEKAALSRSSQTFGVLLNSELTVFCPLHPGIRSRHPLTFAEHRFKQVVEAETRL